MNDLTQVVGPERRCGGSHACFDKSDEEECEKRSCMDGPFIKGVYCDNIGPIGCLDMRLLQFMNRHKLQCNATSVLTGIDDPGCLAAEHSKSQGEKRQFLHGAMFSVSSPDINSTATTSDTANNSNDKNTCSEGFFACTNALCIPTALLNNGERDCPRGEDEDIPVENFTCPGYYRCYWTGMCVYSDLLCDGIYHCPWKDDEMYCPTVVMCPNCSLCNRTIHRRDLLCPQDKGCVCEGLAFRCSSMIDPLSHLHLRYLDLSGVKQVSFSNLHYLEFLAFLKLSHCDLTSAVLHDMLALLVLDLSHNRLSGLSIVNITNLPKLRTLSLSYNPLVTTLNSDIDEFLTHGSLEYLEILEMRDVGAVRIESDVWGDRPRLRHIDLRENDLKCRERRMLVGLRNIEELYVDTPMLCCDYFVSVLLVKYPYRKIPLDCQSPRDKLSSCSDLLAHNSFRVFLWILSPLALLGNAGVFYYRLFVHRDRRGSYSSFRVLVSSLCVADWLMGVYMLIVGVADAVYQGVYMEKERVWSDSVACIVAGVLSLVSSEVSAFILCLITLERVLTICFPLNDRLHLTYSACVALCVVAWLLGLAMAAGPLLVGLQFYGQDGICVPLPITRKEFNGQTYAFAIFICLNFVLFLLIGAGQVAIYRTVRMSGVSSGRENTDRDMALTRRLLLIAASDFLCWFPIGLLGLLAAGGVPIPLEVNVWAAIFVLPFNSALNPFLYTLNGLLEQRRRR
jgi:hypothetical protein